MSSDTITLIAGNANMPLAKKVAKYLETPLSEAIVDTFSDGETHVQVMEEVRGSDVFLIQPTGPPVNHNFMELLILLDAVRRASAMRITVVMPYFAYARQDRKDQPRVPITAKLVANVLTAAGADRVLTLDLHAHQIQGFFDIPLDHLYAMPVFIDVIKKQKLDNPVIATPDVGGIKMARGYAARLETNLAVIDKRRISDQDTEVMNILGDVDGRDVVIVDDIIATAGSMVEAAIALKKAGAKRIYAAASHPILCGPAIERLENSVIEKLWVTDTIQLTKEQKHHKVHIVSVASLVGEAIRRIHNAESISSLFK